MKIFKSFLCFIISVSAVSDSSAEEVVNKKDNHCIVPVLNQPSESSFASRDMFETLLGSPHVLIYGYGTYMWGIRNFNKAFTFYPNFDVGYLNVAYIEDGSYALMYYKHDSKANQIRVDDGTITRIKAEKRLFTQEHLETLRRVQKHTLEAGLKRRFEGIVGRSHDDKCIGCNYYLGITGAELVDPVLMREKDAPAAEKLIITSRNGTFVLGYGKNKGKLCEKVNESYGQYLGVKKVYENVDDVVLDVKPLNEKTSVIVLQSGKFVLLGESQSREVGALDAIVKKLTIKQALENNVYLLDSEVIGQWIVFYEDEGMKYLLDLNSARKTPDFAMHANADVEIQNLGSKTEIRQFVESVTKSKQWRKSKKVIAFAKSVVVEKSGVVYFINGEQGNEGIKVITKDSSAKMTNKSDGAVLISSDEQWLRVSSDGKVTSWTPKESPPLGESDEIFLVGGELYANIRKVVFPGNSKTFESEIYHISADGVQAVEKARGRAGYHLVKYVDEDVMMFTLGSALYALKERKTKLMINDSYRVGGVRQVFELEADKYLVSAVYGLIVVDDSGGIYRVKVNSEYFLGARILETNAGIFIYSRGALYKIT